MLLFYNIFSTFAAHLVIKFITDYEKINVFIACSTDT